LQIFVVKQFSQRFSFFQSIEEVRMLIFAPMHGGSTLTVSAPVDY